VKEDQAVHDKRYRERAIKSLRRRAQELGMTLTPKAV
jgi:transposase